MLDCKRSTARTAALHAHKVAFMVQEFYWSELGWLALLMNNEENCENKITCDISPSARCFLCAAAESFAF